MLRNSLRSRYEKRKRSEEEIHVSDILPSACLRKQFYSRNFPDLDSISDQSLHHYISDESSEFIIRDLANMGVAQANLEMDGLIVHPNILDKDVIIELKDTQSNRRLDWSDSRFRAYIRQLLYYLVITDKENGIVSIRYTNNEMRWIRSDDKGDYFFRPFDGLGPRIESWSVTLLINDILRDLLKNEMIRSKNLFIKALKENDVSSLPRVDMKSRNIKCTNCIFYDKCINEDKETQFASEMAIETDLLDIQGVVDYKP